MKILKTTAHAIMWILESIWEGAKWMLTGTINLAVGIIKGLMGLIMVALIAYLLFVFWPAAIVLALVWLIFAMMTKKDKVIVVQQVATPAPSPTQATPTT